MALSLTPEQREALGDFLRYWLSLPELKGLAFELGTPFEVLTARTRRACASALVQAAEQAGCLGCLQDRLRALLPHVSLPPLPSLPPCPASRKVEVILSADWASVSVSALRRELASAFHVSVDQVAWVAAAGPALRLLVGLSDVGSGLPPGSGIDTGQYGQGRVSAFDGLSRRDRATWRRLACRHPPTLRDDRLSAVASWTEVRYTAAKWGALILAVALIGVASFGVWFRERVWPRVPGWWMAWRQAHAASIAAAWHWIEFLGSVLLSLLALSWLSVAFFGLLAALAYLCGRLVSRLAARRGASPCLGRFHRWASGVVGRHDRIAGTVLNLCAAGCALFAFSTIVRRPLDYWDLGIEALIVGGIELVVLGVILRWS